MTANIEKIILSYKKGGKDWMGWFRNAKNSVTYYSYAALKMHSSSGISLLSENVKV